MDTTTPVDGVAPDDASGNHPNATQPTSDEQVATQTTVAVADEEVKADESTSQNDQPNAEEAAIDADNKAPDAQATDELAKFAKAKGFDPANLSEGERKALDMARNAEKRMHEVTASKGPEPPILQDGVDDEALNEVIERQNRIELQSYVRDWFEAHPDTKEYRNELKAIADARPHLSSMDDVYAHFLANPDREAQLKKEGGREALTNLAQKQQAVPPTASAVDTAVYKSQEITPANVDEMVAKHGDDPKWYAENRDTIRQASFGQTRR